MQIRGQVSDLCHVADLAGAVHQSLVTFDDVLGNKLAKELFNLSMLGLIDVAGVISHLCQQVNSIFGADCSQELKHLEVE